ncbi:hypothetical protein L6164_026693 [Bauhinia variegata]|uniref:Uncharacterized protein n=1 Tax=Bauhinia variegata TaxID=167791 RepID=A0ACB9LRW0_BAUVA|nr:hypothetical protein L6164_026693 [Bauhinia variegata]
MCGDAQFVGREEVSVHVDSCVSNEGGNGNAVSEFGNNGVQSNNELEVCVGTNISGKPSEGSVEIVLKLLKNIVREPENANVRRIRLSNPKIKEAVGDVAGGVELLSYVGFELREEDGENMGSDGSS